MWHSIIILLFFYVLAEFFSPCKETYAHLLLHSILYTVIILLAFSLIVMFNNYEFVAANFIEAAAALLITRLMINSYEYYKNNNMKSIPGYASNSRVATEMLHIFLKTQILNLLILFIIFGCIFR